MDGGRGADVVIGGGGDDFIEAVDNFADKLYGGDGNDQINIGDGDKAYGGAGNDFFNAPQKSFIDCGPGKDSVFYFTKAPRTKNCERVKYAPIG